MTSNLLKEIVDDQLKPPAIKEEKRSGNELFDKSQKKQDARKQPKTKDKEGRPRKQADVLIDIGRNHVLFHDSSRTAYAQVGNAVYLTESAAYREVLAESFLKITGKGCNRNALGDALTTLSSIGKFQGDCRPVSLRVGGGVDRIVIDTGSADHALIEVTAEGWRALVSNRPMFRRVGAMQSLPEPAEPNFSLLWNYVTITEEHRPLLAGFLLSVMCPTGPYPALHLSGEQGTGKSTLCRVIRKLTDPSASALRSPPKELRDLLVGALNGWVLTIDNVSCLSPQLSDALCRLSTGGAISERALYTNVDEILVEVQRPVILNGIEDLATRPDLAERGLHIELEPIDTRRTEREFWNAFDRDAPHILGALLEGLTMCIRNHKDIQIGELPRMADFAKWAAAGMEPLGFTAEEFMVSYRENLKDSQTASVESSPVGEAINLLMLNKDSWIGTATELMAELANVADDAMTRNPAWPKSARWMTGTITRLAPALRSRGIDVERKRTGDSRLISLCRSGKIASLPSPASSQRIISDADDGNDAKNRGQHINGNSSPSWEIKPLLVDAIDLEDAEGF